MTESEQERKAIRDGFAAAALVGIVAGRGGDRDWSKVTSYAVALDAYAMADAMMAARNGTPPQPDGELRDVTRIGR